MENGVKITEDKLKMTIRQCVTVNIHIIFIICNMISYSWFRKIRHHAALAV